MNRQPQSSLTPKSLGSLTLLDPRSVLAVTLTCFVALAIAAALVGVFPADALVSRTLLDWRSPALLNVMYVINAAGDWRLLVPGTALLYVAFPRARTRWGIWLALMLAAAIAPDLMKFLVGRPRPYGHALGFPSGHTTGAAAYFGAVIYLAGSLRPRLRMLVRVGAILIIVLVAIARVMLRAHWPSDTLGGIAFGLALASSAAVLASAVPRSAG